MLAWEVLTLLWRLLRELDEEIQPELEAMGLASYDPWLMAELEQHRYPSEAMRRLKMPLSTVSQMLRRLEAHGLVRRSLDPKDLRRHRLELTPKGKEVLRQSQALIIGAMERRLSRLSAPEQKALARYLEALTQNQGGEG